MKKDYRIYLRAKGKTDTGLAKLIFCGRKNMKALFLKTGGNGNFWIVIGKKSEIEFPTYFTKTNEFRSHWFEIYDDERRLCGEYYDILKTKKTEIYQHGSSILLIEVDE